MKNEREPGSLQLQRDAEERERRQQYVQSWESAPPSELGRIERTCASCGDHWEPFATGCPRCGSTIFNETLIAPTPVEAVREADRPPGGRWRPWRRPEAPPEPRATPSEIEALRALVAHDSQREPLLRAADAELRSMVNRGVQGTGPLQALLADQIGALDHGDRPALSTLSERIEALLQ